MEFIDQALNFPKRSMSLRALRDGRGNYNWTFGRV
jgi:hypothetical protein